MQEIRSRISARINFFNSREYQTFMKEAKDFDVEQGIQVETGADERIYFRLEVPLLIEQQHKLETFLESDMIRGLREMQI